MTKNEIVARWMGWNTKMFQVYSGEKEQAIWFRPNTEPFKESYLTTNELEFDSNYNWLMEAWTKFRDLKFEYSPDFFEIRKFHETLCERIINAVMRKTITEAFDELVKGIEWAESLKK